MALLKAVLLFILLVFIVPTAATTVWWMLQERPNSWRSADWSASGVLPVVTDTDEAAVYVMAARLGGLKGAISVHSWIVTKEKGASRYNRFDVVGWGSPVRRNGYPADGRWYSNEPVIMHAVVGAQAEALIPRVEAAVDAYPYARAGDYVVWPGPNSNSFVAWVLREVPEIGARMPPNATGRDFAPGVVDVRWTPQTRDLHVTLGGFVGFAAGWTSGFEVHFLGVVAGIDLVQPALKIPGFGRVEASIFR
ncbi:MAG TPA: DUF3750 domain-containing protein [Tianweitania sediminis]|nr:DUF3750 domain-containing protein [Tianweitania sediminis]